MSWGSLRQYKHNKNDKGIALMFTNEQVEAARQGKVRSLTPRITSEEMCELIASGATKGDLIKIINERNAAAAKLISN